MKSKLFSVLTLIIAVLFVSALQPVEASTDAKDTITIDEVVSMDNLSMEAEQDISFADGPEFTAMEVCTIAQNFEGDIDHQLITIRAGKNHTGELSGYVPYRARSNLYDSDYLG